MGMAFIGVLVILIGGSSGGGRVDLGEMLGMTVVFILSVVLIVVWASLPLYVGEYLEDHYSRDWHLMALCCAVWYGGTLTLNYKLAIRAERRQALRDAVEEVARGER